MLFFTKRLITLCASLFLATSLFAQFNSYEKAAIEKLVEKKIITPEYASAITKDYAIVAPQKRDTKKVQLWGMAQLQYDWISTEMEPYQNITKGFNVRRVFLGVKSDISDSFHTYAIIDFCRTKTNGSDYILDAYATKDFDNEFLYGDLQVGFRKVQMGLEENISCMKLSTVETSIVTRYFVYSQRTESRIGFGQRYAGLFWNGKVRQIKGLKYYLALTNSMNNTLYPEAHLSGNKNNPRGKCDFNYWLTIDYTTKIDEDSSLRFGFKSGFGPSANIVTNDKYGRIFSFDPFFEYKYKDDFTLWGEFLYANIQYGKNNGTDTAAPYAYNIGGEYRFEIPYFVGQFGVSARFSHLFTDGRGVSPKDMITYWKNATTDISSPVSYETSWSICAGLNWYILGDTLKVQFGYEHARFNNPHHNLPLGDASMHILRAQMQVVF